MEKKVVCILSFLKHIRLKILANQTENEGISEFLLNYVLPRE